MLPECQLRGWKFLTSHRTNKHCTPALHSASPRLIKGSVSADSPSAGARGEAQETAHSALSGTALWRSPLCLGALHAETLLPTIGSGARSGPLTAQLQCVTATERGEGRRGGAMRINSVCLVADYFKNTVGAKANKYWGAEESRQD